MFSSWQKRLVRRRYKGYDRVYYSKFFVLFYRSVLIVLLIIGRYTNDGDCPILLRHSCNYLQKKRLSKRSLFLIYIAKQHFLNYGTGWQTTESANHHAVNNTVVEYTSNSKKNLKCQLSNERAIRKGKKKYLPSGCHSHRT